MKKRPRPPLRDILHEAWGMLFGIVLASMAVFAAKTDLQSWNNRIGVTVFFVAGLAIFGASVRKMVQLFRPPPPAIRKLDKNLGRIIGLWLAFCVAMSMVVGSLCGLLSGFVLPLLRTGTFRSGPLLAIPIASFGMAILLILPDAMRERRRRRKAPSSNLVYPFVAVSGRRRALAFCFLTAFPRGVGLLILGAVVVKGFTPSHVINLFAGGAFLAFGLFLARWAIPYARRNNGRPFVKLHAPPGEVVPGRPVTVLCDIEPAYRKNTTRLLVRPFVAILTLDEETPLPLDRNPEGQRPDDAAAWYGEPFLDVTDPGAMAHASFELTLPDFREFSRKEGFNPWSDSVEWRLEALLFRSSSCIRRAVYRIRVPAHEFLSRPH